MAVRIKCTSNIIIDEDRENYSQIIAINYYKTNSFLKLIKTQPINLENNKIKRFFMDTFGYFHVFYLILN